LNAKKLRFVKYQNVEREEEEEKKKKFPIKSQEAKRCRTLFIIHVTYIYLIKNRMYGSFLIG